MTNTHTHDASRQAPFHSVCKVLAGILVTPPTSSFCCRPHECPLCFSPCSQSCSECPEPTLAQSLCTLCNKWLCYQCTDVHQHHHRAPPATSQCADVHAALRPGADQHQKGCSSLPAAGQGKMFDASVSSTCVYHQRWRVPRTVT